MKTNTFFKILMIPLLFLGLMAFQSPVVSQVSPASNQKSHPGVKLFPNPAKDFLNISIENNIYSKVDLIVYNSLGGEVSRKTESTESSNEIRLNVSQLRNGLYLIKITVDNQSFTRSFLKE